MFYVVIGRNAWGADADKVTAQEIMFANGGTPDEMVTLTFENEEDFEGVDPIYGGVTYFAPPVAPRRSGCRSPA